MRAFLIAHSNVPRVHGEMLAIPPRTNLKGVAPPGTPTFAETGVPANAFNPFNPFNQIISGGSRTRLFEFGNRMFDDTTDAFLATIGVKGDKLFDGTWGYDAGFRYSKESILDCSRHSKSGHGLAFNAAIHILTSRPPI